MSQLYKLLILLLLLNSCSNSNDSKNSAFIDVLKRQVGEKNIENFVFRLQKDTTILDKYAIKKVGQRIQVSGNSPVAICRGTYDYLKTKCNSIIQWSGSKINLPENLPAIDKEISSPYQYRYYFNVVTHGYTTAYWDWARWEREIDWMAMHGINMPLIGGAHEAILDRVFEKIGLTKEEREQYFSGPAHFPWNRMGNLNGWDGPLPDSYFKKQIALTHQILKRINELEMRPIIHAFAGFVPKSITRLYPEIKIKELGWGGGLPKENNAFILSPSDPLFAEIGKIYIQEWEKEFGEGEFYLADSFNEMDVPVSENQEKALQELASYGSAVFKSISKANPNATWVMQGWTFPYHKDKNGDLFWTKERLGALVSKVPDDKLLILDLANEYNHVFWKIDPSWKMYDGFFGKKWIYSFIPNMGGKVPLNGKLDVYASIPIDALNYKDKKNLVGFGFAPEGIENNEIIYELLSDMAWTEKEIQLDEWIEKYCLQRYGSYPEKMKEAFELLNQSCFGNFTDHPMHRYQFRPYENPPGVENRATVHTSETFEKAVEAFLSCSEEFKNSMLYTYDAIELAVQYFGLVADKKLRNFLEDKKNNKEASLDSIMNILYAMDRLLASHPNHLLQKWIDYARSWGDNEAESNYYESNAKRLITTWGGDPVNDYSGRVWNGLIRDYYIPRWVNYHQDNSKNNEKNMRQWEETWIKTPWKSASNPFNNPVLAAKELFKDLQKVRQTEN